MMVKERVNLRHCLSELQSHPHIDISVYPRSTFVEGTIARLLVQQSHGHKIVGSHSRLMEVAGPVVSLTIVSWGPGAFLIWDLLLCLEDSVGLDAQFAGS
jgi:hypothetical protein